MTGAIGPRAESAIGQSVERADGRLKLAGQAEFTGDIRLPGMLYGAVLHSPVAHARISSIDTSAAEKLDGVVAILTAEDLSDLDPYHGHALRDRPPEPAAAGGGGPARRQAPRRRPDRRRRKGRRSHWLVQTREPRSPCQPCSPCQPHPTHQAQGTRRLRGPARGQGARTVMAQIAVGVLKAPMNKVVVRGTDTRYTPYDRSTGASRSTTVAGLAVQRGPRRTSWTRCWRRPRPGWRPRRSCSPRPTAPSPIRTAGR